MSLVRRALLFPFVCRFYSGALGLILFQIAYHFNLERCRKNEVEIIRKPCIRQTGSIRKQSHRFLICTRLQTGELTAGTGKQDPGASIAISFSLALCLKQ